MLLGDELQCDVVSAWPSRPAGSSLPRSVGFGYDALHGDALFVLPDYAPANAVGELNFAEVVMLFAIQVLKVDVGE